MVKTLSTSVTRSHRNKSIFNPFTPIRKLLRSKRPCNTSYALGKRRRDSGRRNNSPKDPIVPTPPSSPLNAAGASQLTSYPSQHVHHPPYDAPNPQARVALQNEDDEEDAVVITTLDTLPFCCHEDLITMSRHQLIVVAYSLNAKLPAILQIDISDRSSDRFIRNSIEVLVGIRKGALMSPPFAPKADRSRDRSVSFSGFSGVEDEKEDDEDDIQQLNMLWNMSPLAKRGKRTCSSPFGTPRSKLARLIEEEEEDMMGDIRQVKRRRLSDEREDVEMADTPVTTRFYGRAAMVEESPTLRKRATTSNSQELRQEMKMMRIAAPLAARDRLRYRTSSDTVRTTYSRPSNAMRGTGK
ncbi:hypothetical protein VNI00_000182 [Paramarasmius palmivorus]|uniref:Uncharacterized protein n=1 Tax=Paramarasmius palmivorus TaxID=297713 RepID=A0AAW0EES4_9AGAR